MAIPKAGKRKEVLAGWHAIAVVPSFTKLFEAFCRTAAQRHLLPLRVSFGFPTHGRRRAHSGSVGQGG